MTKSITAEIEALRAMKVPELVEKYREAFQKEPRVRHKEWLWKRICWRLQERKFGGLTRVAQRRLEELIAEIDIPIDERNRTVTGTLSGPVTPSEPTVGTVLTRRYKGRDIRVHVVDGGFEWNGIMYKSLSAVAKAITGTHWNGPLFFGVTRRKKRDGKG